MVIGAGTAGCVLAERLTEDSATSVMVLEPGRRVGGLNRVPLLGIWLWMRRQRQYVWDFRTVPQEALSGRQVRFPIGKAIGGSTVINAMIYCRGHRGSYDRWNLAGWSYRDLLPYFARIEDEESGARAGYGRGGTLRISPTRFRHRYGATFLAACQEAGIPVSVDLPPGSDGAGFYSLTHRNGFRETARSYLDQTTDRPNLRVRENVLVTRILFDRDWACGAEFVWNGKLEQVRVRGEVILCAGSIGSPTLLQRSGIGPEGSLRRHGIPVLAPRNRVGANLRDHVRVPMVFASHGPSYSAPWRVLAAAAQYAVSRTGLFTSNTADLGALIRSDPSLPAPDLRLIFKWKMSAEHSGNCVGIEAGLMDPVSAGSVQIASANPADPPRIDPAYLQAPEDLRRIRIAMERARDVMATKAARAGGIGEELLPGVGDGAQNDEQYVRSVADSSFHVVGTCGMGNSEDSVVDLHLRVRGVRNLRIVDGSVVPVPVAGNAQAVVYAVAERAADLIRGRAPLPPDPSVQK